MGNCCNNKKNEELEKILRESEIKLTKELRKTIESICFKNLNNKRLKTEEEIMKNYNVVKELGAGLFSSVYLV